ncbi:putative DUF2203 domain-containing protein [Chryseobacterium sp. IT-36CA2]
MNFVIMNEGFQILNNYTLTYMSNYLFATVEEARNGLRLLAQKKFSEKIKALGVDKDSLSNLDVEILKQKKDAIWTLIKSETFIKENSWSFKEGVDYTVEEPANQRKYAVVGFTFTIQEQLNTILRYINEKISEEEQTKIIDSIKNIIEDLPNEELRKKIDAGFEDLKEQTKKFEDILKETDNKFPTNEIEIRRYELELFDKKTEIWLKILAKESIASILGGILLIVLTICLICIMFLKREPIKIVETAFLLILGYFFGQSTSKSIK